jgi:hypothetical protein
MRTAGVVGFLIVSTSACHGAAPPQLTTLDDHTPVMRGRTYAWRFDAPVGTPGTGAPMIPEHPRTFINVLGTWGIEKDAHAASAPNVYRQRGRYEGWETPRVVVSELVFGDMSLDVRCRPESGTASESCGVMFRVADQDSYLVVRAEAKDGTLKLVRVLGGVELELASAPADVTANTWHSLAIKTRAEQVVVWWDEMRLLNAIDERLPEGKVGLWTRADAVTAFDDLVVRAD